MIRTQSPIYTAFCACIRGEISLQSFDNLSALSGSESEVCACVARRTRLGAQLTNVRGTKLHGEIVCDAPPICSAPVLRLLPELGDVRAPHLQFQLVSSHHEARFALERSPLRAPICLHDCVHGVPQQLLLQVLYAANRCLQAGALQPEVLYWVQTREAIGVLLL